MGDTQANQRKKTRGEDYIAQGSILAVAVVITKIIGVVYRIPLTNILGDEGNGFYGYAYQVYAIALMLSSLSLPTAVSKLVSVRMAVGQRRNAFRVFLCSLIFAVSVGIITWCWYWIYWKPDYNPQTFKGMIINKSQWIHRITAVLLIVMIGVAATVQITPAAENSSAKKSENTSTSLKEAQQEKAALEKALEDAKQTINELKESKGKSWY